MTLIDEHPEPQLNPGESRRRHRTAKTVTLVVVLVGLAAAGLLVSRSVDDSDSVVATAPPTLEEATVERGDITASERIDGTVVETDTMAVVHRVAASASTSSRTPDATTSTQVVTGVVAPGDDVTSGGVLYTVDGQPVVALAGVLPAWRSLSSSSSDGADIWQLEAALVALGYDPDGDVTVDDDWDSDTTAMVKRWQQGTNAEVTGGVPLGSLVFIAHPTAVASVDVAIGDEIADGATLMELSGTKQQIVIELPTELQALVVPSMVVDIDGVSGTVSSLRSAEGTDGATVQAIIEPSERLPVVAGSAATVTLEITLASNQLVVPTDSIVSLLDGSYAVQTNAADGTVAYLPVEVVAVSGNRTAVTGAGVTESMVVLRPA